MDQSAACIFHFLIFLRDVLLNFWQFCFVVSSLTAESEMYLINHTLTIYCFVVFPKCTLPLFILFQFVCTYPAKHQLNRKYSTKSLLKYKMGCDLLQYTIKYHFLMKIISLINCYSHTCTHKYLYLKKTKQNSYGSLCTCSQHM